MKHILVVDDNKTNLMTAKAALQEQYKVTAVLMGVHALKFLESNMCDLILLDIDMPQMDGFEVLARIKEMQLEAAGFVFDGQYGTGDARAVHYKRRNGCCA